MARDIPTAMTDMAGWNVPCIPGQALFLQLAGLNYANIILSSNNITFHNIAQQLIKETYLMNIKNTDYEYQGTNSGDIEKRG